jgi:hypothetical protein
MTTKLKSAVLATALRGLPIVATAQIGFGVTIAPPAPRYEPVPPPRAGWVWAPGYWNWVNGHKDIGSRRDRAIVGWVVLGNLADRAGTGRPGIGSGNE